MEERLTPLTGNNPSEQAASHKLIKNIETVFTDFILFACAFLKGYRTRKKGQELFDA